MDAKMKKHLHEVTASVLKDAEAVSHEIWSHPESGDHEFHAVEYLTGRLQEAGFRIRKPLAGLETAFEADYGKGKPRIALLAEYDALPGFGPNQDQWGHACGHNWIAANTYGTAMVMKKLIDEGLIKGTICYMGCPAEETTGGKIPMAEQGVFDDMDLAMQIHITGGTQSMVGGQALALNGIEFTFHGVSSHAAAAPQNGINALDACYLMFNGINALRQHVTPDVRMHGVIINGGLAPNVVPALAVSRWEVRAAERESVDMLEKKVLNIAQGACLMTGATYEWKYFENRFDNCVFDSKLLDVLQEGMKEAGVKDIIRPDGPGAGSTDVGNVSQVCPTVYANLAVGNTDGYGTHQEGFLQHTDSKLAYKALEKAIFAQAYTCVQACTDKGMQAEIRRQKRALKK